MQQAGGVLQGHVHLQNPGDLPQRRQPGQQGPQLGPVGEHGAASHKRTGEGADTSQGFTYLQKHLKFKVLKFEYHVPVSIIKLPTAKFRLQTETSAALTDQFKQACDRNWVQTYLQSKKRNKMMLWGNFRPSLYKRYKGKRGN